MLANTLLLIFFILLKVTNTVNWGWWIILTPIWIPITITIILIILQTIIAIGDE